MNQEAPIRVLNIFMVLDRGGAETLVMNIYRKLDRSKVQFDFMVHGDKIGAYEEEIKSLGGKIYRMPPISLRTLFTYNKALKVFFKEHPEYRIVHAHNSELGYFVLRQAQIAGIPVRICHAHSSPNVFSLNSFLRFIFKHLADHHTTHRFACSDMAGCWQFGKNSIYEVFKNGIDTERFRFDESLRKRRRQEYGWGDSLVLGHVGRFTAVKNHVFLLEIVKELLGHRKDIVLALAGDGPLKNNIEQRSREMGIGQYVRFLGVQEDIPGFLNACDIFVFPSLYEGLGIASIEAQATGLPVFSSTGVPTESAMSDLCTFLPLEKPQAWVSAILNYDAKYRQGRMDDVRAKGYDIQNTAELLEKFYLNCI